MPCRTPAWSRATAGSRLFVADANGNVVSVVQLPEGRVVETLCSAPDPGSPPGTTPDAVALDRTGSRLYVADADANCVAEGGARTKLLD